MADVAKARADLEKKRKIGMAITGPEMDSAHQQALKALVGEKQTMTPAGMAEEEEKKRQKILGRKY